MRRRGISVAPALALMLALAAGPAAAAPLDGAFARQLARAGGASGAYVRDLTSDRTLAAIRADVPRSPASVEKLYTTTTALLRFGAAATLTTSVLGAGSLDALGSWHGDVYLRGGGDPTFGATGFAAGAYGVSGPTVAELAAQLAAAGVQRVTGGVYGDESLLDTLRGPPASGYALDLSDLGGPLGGLLFDRGLATKPHTAPPAHPATVAAQQLAAELRRDGIHVGRRAGARTTPAGVQPLAAVASPSIATLVTLTLTPSDNFIAELLLKDLGARFGGGGSSVAGVGVVRGTIARLRIHPTIVDGSGLSRADRTTPRQVVTLLASQRANGALHDALPIAGRTGTLAARMRHSAARDRCRAKTGTLSDVSALAGYCTTRNGHLLAFAFIENHVAPLRAKAIEDRLTIALARLLPGAQAPAAPPSSSPPSAAPTGGGASPASSASRPASSST